MKLPSLFEVARNEGRAEGIAIGEARGEERMERMQHSIMENLIAAGISPQDAAKYTGLAEV